MTQDGDGWVEIDGCLEHPDGGRVFRVMLGKTEVWFARGRKTVLAGPYTELHVAKHMSSSDYNKQEPDVWQLTAESRKQDTNPQVSSVVYEPEGGIIDMWKIDIQGAPPFWVLTRHNWPVSSYRAETYEEALGGARTLLQYDRIAFD